MRVDHLPILQEDPADLTLVAATNYYTTYAIERRRGTHRQRPLGEAVLWLLSDRVWERVYEQIKTRLHASTHIPECSFSTPRVPVWVAFGGGWQTVARLPNDDTTSAITVGLLLAGYYSASASLITGSNATAWASFYNREDNLNLQQLPTIWLSGVLMTYVDTYPERLVSCPPTPALRRHAEQIQRQLKTKQPMPPIFTLDIREEDFMAIVDQQLSGEKPQAYKPRIAVVGGDERVTRQEWPASVTVQAYTAQGLDTRRVIDAAASGRLDKIVILTRWISHTQFETLRKCRVPVIAWPHGIPRLAAELPQLVGLTAEGRGVRRRGLDDAATVTVTVTANGRGSARYLG